MTLFRIVDRKAKDPIRLPTTDEIEGSFTRVPAVAALMSIDELATHLAKQSPLLVGVADVYIYPVIQSKLEGETPAELTGAQPAFVPVVDCDALTLPASDFMARFDHPDIVVRYADVLRPVYANVADHWRSVLDVTRPARLVVAFDVDDVCLGTSLAQLVQPEGVFCYFALQVVLPAGVTAMLRKSMEVCDIPR